MPASLPFVGREDVIEKLLYSIRPGRAAFWISGPAGVGKTYLVEHLRQCVADENVKKQHQLSRIKCLFAQTDRRQRDAAQAMNRLLSDLDRELERQGCSSKKWQKAYESWRKDYKRYEELLRQAESDLNAPPDLRRTLALLSVDAVSILAPVAITASGYPPIGAALTNIAQLGNGAKDFLGRWFEAREMARVEEDRKLLCRPVQSLTPKFREALSQLDSDSVRAVLILDEYELTCPFLDPWLTLLFDDDFLQQFKLVMLILSQYPLPRGSGSQCYAEFSEIRLETFDSMEIKEFVESVSGSEYLEYMEYIYQQSGRLPGLVDALVEALVKAGGQLGEQVHRAIKDELRRLDRSILELIEVDSLKRLARLCAVPRLLNVDVFEDVKKFMLDQHGCNLDITIKWLESQPFVENWRYDPTVRAVLLRSLYDRSPRAYEGLNRYLEEICANEIQIRDLSDGGWCEAHARRWYHGLAASPRRSLAKALADFVESLDRYYHPDGPPGTIVALDIVSILEDLWRVRQDVEAFRLWSDYVSSFHKDIEEDVSGDKRDECYLELFKQLIEFHYHCELQEGDVRKRAYQDYDGFADAQVIDYLKRYGELLWQVKHDYGEAYEQFRKALKKGDQDAQTRKKLVSSFIRLAREDPPRALDYLQEDEDLLNQMLPELPQGLANKFEEVGEQLSHA